MSGHETGLLGAYVLGVLDHDEQEAVQGHLDSCAACRREVDDLRDMEAALGEIPPEAFLEGPPPEGDLLLHRTLAEVRTRSRRRTWRNRALVAAAAVLVTFLALGAGTAIGRVTGTNEPVVSSPVAPLFPATEVRTGAATDPDTGVTMQATIKPAAGWVRLGVTITGVPAGEQCRLVVVARDGSREQAGSWLAPDAGTATVDGAALMAPADVTAVQAETYAGEILVAVSV